jgi:hypothetical protein
MSLLVKMPLQKKLNKKIILFKKKLEKQEKNWKKNKENNSLIPINPDWNNINFSKERITYWSNSHY